MNRVLSFKHAVDAWVLRHVRDMQVAVAVLGVLLVAASAIIAFGGRGGTSRLAQLPPTPPSPSSTLPSPSISTSSLSAAPTSAHASTSKAKPVNSKCTADSTHGAGGAVPVHICIPAIGVNADVLQMGLNPDHTVEVPPLSEVSLAGWYKYSPPPGAIGPSVILGHVDSAQYGKGVFFDLGKLQAGDRFSLMRADGMLATFKVDDVKQYPKTSFPTQSVYGNTNNAAIRLITCGGTFDPAARSYEDNIVAYGSLVSLKRA